MSLIDQSAIAALVPDDVRDELMIGATEASVALGKLRRLPDMVADMQRLPVLDALPTAYFVDSTPTNDDYTQDTDSLKKTTRMAWENVYVYPAEIACIVPIPESCIADAAYPIWDQVKPRVSEAIAAVVDGGILFGYNAPVTWPAGGVVGIANTAGNTVAIGGVGTLSIYDDIFDESGLLSLIEEGGFIPDGYVGKVSMRAKLRGTKDADGNPIFLPSMQSPGQYVLGGDPISFSRLGLFENTSINPPTGMTKAVQLIAGDWKQGVWSMRQDMTWKLLDQAIIQDPTTGDILYNLAQQDMVALRVYIRMGWAHPNLINRMNANRTNSPWAVLTDA